MLRKAVAVRHVSSSRASETRMPTYPITPSSATGMPASLA